MFGHHQALFRDFHFKNLLVGTHLVKIDSQLKTETHVDKFDNRESVADSCSMCIFL